MPILYFVALLLFFGWALGVFAFSMTGLIHIVIVIAVIALLIEMLRGPRRPLW